MKLRSLILLSLVSWLALASLCAQSIGSPGGALSLPSLVPTDTLAKRVLDVERYRITYQMKHWVDPGDTLKVREYQYLLQVGELYQKFWPKRWQMADSIYDHEVVSKTANHATYGNLSSAKLIVEEPEVILRDLAAQTITTRINPRLNGTYEYSEPNPEFRWKLIEGDSIVAGYKCRQATTVFRGRRFFAWYAPEVELSTGPVRFAGLPGVLRLVCPRGGALHWASALCRPARAYLLHLRHPRLLSLRAGRARGDQGLRPHLRGDNR
nr:GLPGLI family protein [Porphyromonas sp. COT-239 OH1446]